MKQLKEQQDASAARPSGASSPEGSGTSSTAPGAGQDGSLATGREPDATETSLSTPGAVLAEGRLLRTCFGVFLFVAWAIAAIIWIWTNVHLVVHGDASALITALAALALLLLLGGMEGLEVSVIDRWQNVWPGHPQSYLAGWLASRQLFVALIVTAATLLANRSTIFLPFTSARITGSFATGVFDLALTTLTVLWFAQILWKHLAAMNPDRYLYYLRAPLFPFVRFVHALGISQPGEWTAHLIERQVDWPASPEEHRGSQGNSPGAIWRDLPIRRLVRSHRKHHQP